MSDAPTAQPSSIPTLLIIDDSAEDRGAFRRNLTHTNSQPYNITEVASAEEGLAHLQKHPTDLVLLDYGLPGIDGITFLKRLKQQSASAMPPVLMLTGQGDECIAAEAIKAGAQDYIVKQTGMAEILQLAVRTALREAALQAKVSAYQAQQGLVQDMVLRIRQSLDVQTILNQTSLEIRKLLACDRVILYRFLSNGEGIIAVESVAPPWQTIQGKIIPKTCFNNDWIEKYLTGHTTVIENIHTSELSACHLQLLSEFQVQSNLVVPIVMGTPFEADTVEAGVVEAYQLPQQTRVERENKTLWGLLIAHQCEAPRKWQPEEIQLLQQLCDQLALALQQSALYQQLKLANHQLENKVDARTAQLKQANQQLLDANQALQASNRDLEQFAYIASHDLREPLRKIKSFAELLAKRYQGELDETGDRYINYVTNGAVRMQRLINDLLAYSRLGRSELKRVNTDLNHSLGQALDTLSHQIVQTQAVIQAQPLPHLAVDALQIEQLFFNLIENALKYSSDAPPDIQISAVLINTQNTEGTQNTEWKFSVQDNGIGIAPEFYERIFTIFQRLHSKSEYSGTGIGLAICQKIVERHGGTIGIESIPEEGTTFWFTLPTA